MTSKQDYVVVARALYACKQDKRIDDWALHLIICTLSDTFKKDNVRFDSGKFHSVANNGKLDDGRS